MSVHKGFGRRSRYKDKTTEDLINLLDVEHDQKTKERRTFAGVLSGPAGAGKSFFMRQVYIKLAESSQSKKVPLFLEARELNSIPLTDFAGMITTAFRIAGQELSKEQAADGLKSGIFSILIDGFDELRLSHERHYAQALESASQEFQLCPLLVSGRPSELLRGFNFFALCQLLPLEHEQTIELIRRLEFDDATKESFVALMEKELFDSHSDFLELPLLCAVMLLTLL